MSLNKLGEKSRATIILGKFVNKPKSNSHWLIAFGKFKAHSHDIFFSWTFDSLLIDSRYLVFGVYFSPHQRNIVCEYKLHGMPIMEYLSWTCFWYWCCSLWINFNFSQFYEDIFRSSRSQMFFEIDALKNFAILRINLTLQHRCFTVRSSRVMLIYR